MTDEIKSYPLCWPIARPRTMSRSYARFSTDGKSLSVADGVKRLVPELERLGARGVIISTNVEPRLDGLPRGHGNPTDPGVAVYFSLRIAGQDYPHCISCDKWTHVADNLAAIAKHVGAIRGQLHWGAADTAQVFAGFRALPAVGAREPWWRILGFAKREDVTAAKLEARRLELALKHHPDRGGSVSRMAEINAAADEGAREVGHG